VLVLGITYPRNDEESFVSQFSGEDNVCSRPVLPFNSELDALADSPNKVNAPWHSYQNDRDFGCGGLQKGEHSWSEFVFVEV